MYEIVSLEIAGLLMIGAMFAILEIAAPWLQRHQRSAYVQRYMMLDVTAFALLVLGLLGGTLEFVEVVEALNRGSMASIGQACAMAFLGIPIVVVASRRLGRLAWRQFGRPQPHP